MPSDSSSGKLMSDLSSSNNRSRTYHHRAAKDKSRSQSQSFSMDHRETSRSSEESNYLGSQGQTTSSQPNLSRGSKASSNPAVVNQPTHNSPKPMKSPPEVKLDYKRAATQALIAWIVPRNPLMIFLMVLIPPLKMLEPKLMLKLVLPLQH